MLHSENKQMLLRLTDKHIALVRAIRYEQYPSSVFVLIKKMVVPYKSFLSPDMLAGVTAELLTIIYLLGIQHITFKIVKSSN